MRLNIKSKFELGTVVILFTGRLGIIYHQVEDFDGRNSSIVAIKITEKMMPAVDIHVYNFESYDRDWIKGSMSLNFDSFGKNYVSTTERFKKKILN
jgi:hypothetical protein